MCPRASLDVSVKRKVSCPCRESNRPIGNALPKKQSLRKWADPDKAFAAVGKPVKFHAGRHFVTLSAFQKKVFFAVIRGPLFELVSASFVIGGLVPPQPLTD